MKKKYILAALALGLSISAKVMAQVPSYVPTSGLVGWYPFTGNANDLSGTNNNGVVNGATLTIDRFGNNNSAYSFNGTTNFISVSNSPFTDVPFTISAWVKLNSLVGFKPIIGLGELGAGTLKRMYFCPDFNSIGTPGIGNIGANGITTTNNVVTAGNWVHIAVCVSSYDILGVTFYINGVAYTNNTIGGSTTPFPLNLAGFTFGKSTGNNQVSPLFFTGLIDDTGIWNRVLTQSEITALYNSTNCIQPTANIIPQGSTNFCQGGFVTLAASTANGNTYKWYVNNNAIGGATSANYVASQSGDYTVVVSNGGCSTTSSAITVTVNTLPSVGLGLLGSFTNIYTTPIILSGSPASGTYTGAGVSGNLFNPLNAGLGAHSIFYNYSDGNGCAGTAHTSTIVYDTLGNVCTISVTDTLVINTSVTGINPPNNINTIKVFPNPANDHITINYGNFAMMNGYTLKITNVLGQVIFTTPINQQSSYIDLSTWNGNGIYFVQILDTQNNIIENRKIVLQ